MSSDVETNPHTRNFNPDGFNKLREAYSQHQPTVGDYNRYGRYVIANTSLLNTPPSVLDRGEVLTNPSQVETEIIGLNGASTSVQFAYFRQEPTSFHLGKTTSVPYLLLRDDKNKVYLSEFTDALTLPGEDPRIVRGVRFASPTGKVHSGWCVSTVVATPMPENPADVQSIMQVFYFFYIDFSLY